MHILIEYQPSLALHLQAYQLYEGQSFTPKIDKAVGYILLGLGCLLTLSLLWISSFGWPFLLSLAFIIISLLEILKMLDFGKLVQIYHFKSNPKFKEVQRLTLTEECMHYETQGITSDLQWSFYMSYLEHNDLFLLIYGKRLYTVIPKAAFSLSDLLVFQRFLKSTYGSPNSSLT